ncbi:MAG: DUF5011 domain-containing protein [Bacilli bacterium]|nr:DUF5011 domain-containing protein [Bacilli bacterium]
MKKIVWFLIAIVFCACPFYSVKAANSYSVEMVSSSSGNQVIGTYSSYSAALSSMNNQNSSSGLVATIYRDGVPVDAKYAIFKFKPSGKSTYSLYRNYNSTSEFTSINSSYGIDAAVLGYSDNGRVKIMMSGFTGWTDINNGVVTPISLIGGNMINVNGTGVNLRSDHSTGSSKVATLTGSYNFNYTETYKGSDYTWYKITYNGTSCWVAGGSWVTLYDSSLGTYYKHYGPSGNLIHHFTTYGGVSYNDDFTNLGTAPSYMAKDVWYYSFDGNYFYSNLTSMLDDYRSGSYAHSINPNKPHYAYYLYLTSRSTTGYTASDFDNVIAGKYTAAQSKMYGTGIYFKEAEEIYGTNALLAFSAALNESKWGTSSIAMNKNNLFGYGAADSCPYDCAYSYNSPRDSIMDYASKSSTSYENASGKYYNGSHYGNKSSGKNIYYATDPYWGEIMASNAFNRDKNFGGKDFNSNTIGVTKKGVSGAEVYRNPDTSSYLYTMKNPKRSDPVYDFSVNIIDKINSSGKDYYKIYTDLSDGPKYGYVLASNFYVSNSQPVINASDKVINVGSVFNYMEGVTATDAENGNLISKVTYTGTVDTSKAGNYNVTYTVADNSNFHVSKTVNVQVVGEVKPTLEATDKEVLQFEEFDYMDGVSASDNNGNLTNNITYEGSVDTNTPGEYSIVYSVSNSVGTTTKTVKITVVLNEKPVIEVKDKNVTIGKEINLLDGVSATDKEDGDITDKVSIESSNVNFNELGEYSVTYTVSDRHNQKTVKTISVNVIEKPIEKTDGEFYLEELKFDNKFTIKGYLIQKGISNSLNDDIKFSVIFKNVLDDSEYKVAIDRWLENTPYDLSDNNDYSGAWFNGSIDLSSLPAGDYDVYMLSEIDNYYAKELFNNIMNSPFSHRGVINEKSYTFRVSQKLKSKAVQLFVRNNVITASESPTFRNMINDYDEITFDNNKFNVSGISYNYGIAYDNPSKITREIIFENVLTFEQYRFDLGCTNVGSYIVTSLDKLSKAYVWFNKAIDINELPNGTYSIIIHTKTDKVDDYGDLTDMFASVSLNHNMNSKNYKVSVNPKREKRVELIIK